MDRVDVLWAMEALKLQISSTCCEVKRHTGSRVFVYRALNCWVFASELYVKQN